MKRAENANPIIIREAFIEKEPEPEPEEETMYTRKKTI